MKTGDKFIIELGEKIAQYQETPDGKRNLIDTVYRIEGTNAAITERDLQNMEEYKEDKDEEEIKVGDECRCKETLEHGNDLFVILKIWYKKNTGYFNAILKNGSLWASGKLDLIKKTGKHYDEVESLLRKLEESEKEEGEIPFL